jgi:type I restriction enzyme, S subunit
MKDSGVEWLGEVPEHWSVKRIKHTARMESGHTPDRKVEAYWVDCDIPWVSLNDTGFLKDNDYISETTYSINKLGMQNSSARLLPGRVVVFSRDATIGRCAITTRPMAVSQHFIAWVCNEEILPEYLLLRLKSMTQELESLTFGATLKTIGMPDVKTLATPVPPMSEQEEIVEYVTQLVSSLEEMSMKSQKAIELLQERRSALISAAVTGQIDVRGLVEAEGSEL